MPFKSQAQQKYMFANHPEIAKEFAKHKNFETLPEKVEQQPEPPSDERRMVAMKSLIGE